MHLRHLATITACSAALVSCGGRSTSSEPLAPENWVAASAPLVDSKGKTVGEVAFREAPAGIFMRITMKGLGPGWHGVHFHQTADCSDGADGFKRSGPHVDPDEHDHGLLHAAGGERGDLPNLFADKKGRVTAEIFRHGVMLRPSEERAAQIGPFALIDDDGFAVIVHAQADDHMSQPIGGAGDRVACAAITG